MMAEQETFDPSSRIERIRAIVDRLLPDDVTCAAFDVDAACAAHPELAPELKLELCKAALIRGARARAGREVNPTAFETLSLSEECGTTATITRAGAPQDDDAAPVLIPGYDIIRELSHGGQGMVYEALQVNTKRKVALKVLLEGRHASSPARRRFLREIELIAQLKHPNIIEIFEAGRLPDGQPFYVMDYVRGEPLHKHIRKHGLALNQVLRLFTSVCDAIQYAHQHGIIHRDLKPSNILVDSDGTPKVLDFGLAKPLHANDGEDALTISEQILGTLPYMAPEQARGHQHEIDTRTDVYALGVILYELLTGQYPYPVAGRLADVLQHIASTPPDKPRRKWSTTTGIMRRPGGKRGKPEKCPIDDDLEVIILKALNKERGRRYQSAGELGRDVQHFLAGEAIEAKRDSAWYVLRKLAGHHRTAAAVTLLVSICVIGFGCVSLYFYAEARQALQQMAVSDQRVLKNARDLDARGYEVMQRARDNNLGWFLLAWQARMSDWAAELMAQTSTKAPERVAMRYLSEPGFSFEELLSAIPPEHAGMAQFVRAERALREDRRADAIDAYRKAAATDSRDWWRRVAEWRLRQLADETASASPGPAQKTEVTDAGRP